MLHPVLTAQEMQKTENNAKQAGLSERTFMQTAGSNIASAVWDFLEAHHLPKKVALLVGKGNNGGDAFAAGIELLKLGVQTHAIAPFTLKESSPLNGEFRTLFIEQGGLCNSSCLSFEKESILVDGLLGTGFQGEIENPLASLIALANDSGKKIFAIDIPSGLNGTTGEVKTVAIKAHTTLCLEYFKSGFFLQDGWNFVGRLQLVKFGLPVEYLDPAKVWAYVPSSCHFVNLFPSIVRNRHKYQAGYVVGFAGSKLFPGSPKLAGLAALRMGAGIVRIFHFEEIGEAPFSLITEKWTKKSWDKELKKASALFFGPGMGQRKTLPYDHNLPVIFDADAIQKDVTYPKNAIITPHRGEVLRLLNIGSPIAEEELFKACQAWVKEHDCILVLKGAPTQIFTKKQAPLIILQGTPAMAKAGTGDVLTGMIAALLAQKMAPIDAAILGVVLHGLAGEKAAQDKTEYGVIAEDLIDALPNAIKHLQKSLPTSNF